MLARALLLAGAGAASGLSEVRAAGARAPAATEPDASTVAYTLGKELLLVFVYQHVLRSGTLGTAAQRLAASFDQQESAHVRSLQTALRVLGGAQPQAPRTVAAADRELAPHMFSVLPSQVHSQRDALRLLIDTEEVVIGAYYAAMSKLEDPALVRLFVQIMADEAQHSTAFNELLYPGKIYRSVPTAFVQGSP